MDKKILTVDDEDFIRELVRDFLELEGIECETAPNLSEALGKLKDGDFDLILLDRNLEDEKVEDVVTALRGIKKAIPIVIMTGDLDVPDEFINEYNISEIIHKPFQYDEFIKTVKKNL